MEVTDVLTARYETTLSSAKLSDFYMNIHGYIDLIIKTPELIALIEIEKSKYYEKVNQIGRNSAKIERLNFYTAHWVDLYIPVYYPLEDYKTTDDPDDRQDPIALIMFYGADSPQVKDWAKNTRNAMSYRNGMKIIKSYAKSIATEARPPYIRPPYILR